MIIKRPTPLHTHLDYAEARLKLLPLAEHGERVLDKQKTRNAMQATWAAADHFNRLFRERTDLAVLHDLRICLPDGRLHIDHLFITDNFHIFVVESRTAATTLGLSRERRFTSIDAQAQACAIPSPIWQLKQNRSILKRVLRDIDFPKSLGRPLTPTFHKFVLIDAQAELSNKFGADYEYFLSPEQLIAMLNQQRRKNSLLSFIGRMSSDELRRIGRQIAQLHTPGKIRFSNKFQHILITPQGNAPTMTAD